MNCAAVIERVNISTKIPVLCSGYKLRPPLAASGGLIIDGDSRIPYESKPENVEAMTEAVFAYGFYG